MSDNTTKSCCSCGSSCCEPQQEKKRVVIGTHPIPMKYYNDHEKLEYWKKANMAELAPYLFNEKQEIMKAYD